MADLLPIPEAIEVFLRGVCATRSFTKPFHHHALTPSIWLMADPPGRTRDRRTSEVVACGATPEEVHAVVSAQGIDRHMLCVLVESAAAAPAASAAFKASGYRLVGREPLFVLPLMERVVAHDPRVRRITTQAEAEVLARAARRKKLLPEHLTAEDAPCRAYACFHEESPIGWVRSIRTHPDRCWVSDLYVAPEFRRQGIGRALMSAMLDDDHRFGAAWSVLLASLTGARLYPHLGYHECGLLLLFWPRRAGADQAD